METEQLLGAVLCSSSVPKEVPELGFLGWLLLFKPHSVLWDFLGQPQRWSTVWMGCCWKVNCRESKKKKHLWGFEENTLYTKVMFYTNSKCKIWRVQLWIWLSKTSQQCSWSCGCALVRALKANTHQVTLNNPHFPEVADSEYLYMHTNKIPKISMN